MLLVEYDVDVVDECGFLSIVLYLRFLENGKFYMYFIWKFNDV